MSDHIAHQLLSTIGLLLILIAAYALVRSFMWGARTDVQVGTLPQLRALLDTQTDILKGFIAENKADIQSHRTRITDLEAGRSDHSRRLRDAERDLAVLKRDTEWVDRILSFRLKVDVPPTDLSVRAMEEIILKDPVGHAASKEVTDAVEKA